MLEFCASTVFLLSIRSKICNITGKKSTKTREIALVPRAAFEVQIPVFVYSTIDFALQHYFTLIGCWLIYSST